MQTITEQLPSTSSPEFDLPAFQQAVKAFLHEGVCRNLSPSTLEYCSLHLLGFQRFLMLRNQALTTTVISFPRWPHDGSAHTFRHTMAKNFLLNGGSVYALQMILGQ